MLHLSTHNLTPLQKFTLPTLDNQEWTEMNNELKVKLHDLHHQISNVQSPQDLSLFGNLLSLEIKTFLESYSNLFLDKPNGHSPGEYIKHSGKNLIQLKHLLKQLRKKAFSNGGTKEDRIEFHNCLKAINNLRKKERDKEIAKKSQHQEKLFNKNRWDFSRKVCRGELGKQEPEVGFNLGTADTYYRNTYSSPVPLDISPDGPLHWFPSIQIHPESETFVPFNCSPFRPKDIKKVLKNSSLKSSPGPDGIPYSILFKFDCLHHILSTLYSKVLSMGCPPSSWSESIVKLIYKKGPTDNPQNYRMIALTSCIGKTYHLLLSSRFTSYLTSNNYIDQTLQKAFLPGINGCIEHNIVLDEIIQNSKTKKKTVHITFFDLADAFGSVPHPLIQHTLRRFHFPPEIQIYINTLYSNQSSKVYTKSFSSSSFRFRKGVFQGDPLSPIIFLMVFNPIIEFLSSKEKSGYTLDEMKFISLPYADDFCLITSNKRTHQNLMEMININIKSMGMELKPSKCRTFSIKSGCPTDINFSIGNDVIPTIFHEEQKFLGKLLFPQNTSMETFKHLKSELTKKLTNIENLHIRNEYKLWIYKFYFLPSIRFLLTIHQVSNSHLSTLNSITTKYIKTWAGLPPCATNAILHLQEGLNIMSLSHLYKLTQCQSHARTRLVGDVRVNQVLDIKLRREEHWTQKHSTSVEAETVYNSTSIIQNILPDHKLKSKIKENVSKHLNEIDQNKWREHINTLIKQGQYLKLAHEEKSDIIWKSNIFNLKKGTMKFLLNASINTLPTKDNLHQWGKSTTDFCTLCRKPPQDLIHLSGNRKETTLHVLNHCPISLHQHRFTWRHDNILLYISKSLDPLKCKFYSDLPGFSLPGGGTLPPHICVTPERPDLVILNEESKEIYIFELTVPLETNISSAHSRKTEKYSHLYTDITLYTPSILPFEIGSRGYISPNNKILLKKIHKFCSPSTSFTNFCHNISTISILSSYYIFITRTSSDWDTNLLPIEQIF